MLLAVLTQVAPASANGAPFFGHPPWLVVLVGAVLAAAALWIFAKLLKWMIWLAIVLVLVGGAITAAKLFLEA